MSYVFISYSSKDREYADLLRDELIGRGFDVWMDYRKIGFKERFFDAIVKGIRGSEAFIILMSPHSQESRWVFKEIHIADDATKPIFPILLEGKEFDILIEYNYYDGRDGQLPIERWYSELAKSVASKPNVRGSDVTPRNLPQGEGGLGTPRRRILASAVVLLSMFAIIAIMVRIASSDTPTSTISSEQHAEMTYEAASTETRIALNATLGQRDVETQTTQLAIDGQETSESNIEQVDTLIDVSSGAGLSPLEVARIGVGNNEQWVPYAKEFNEVEMVLVPTGCFMMGSEDYETTRPIHEQCIDVFWIDKYEVTNDRFNSVNCPQSSSSPNQPHNCITWFDAKSHCEERSARLPTEAEWEYAARGVNNYIYPWGNNFDPLKLVWSGNSDGVFEVGSKPAGASWVGAMDMAGNIWELTSTIRAEYPYHAYDGREDDSDDVNMRVARGGSFYEDGLGTRSAVRIGIDSTSSPSFVGFRCARDFEG